MSRFLEDNALSCAHIPGGNMTPGLDTVPQKFVLLTVEIPSCIMHELELYNYLYYLERLEESGNLINILYVDITIV